MKHLYLTDIKKGIFPGVTMQVEMNERESLMVRTGCCHIAINKSLVHRIIIGERT